MYGDGLGGNASLPKGQWQASDGAGGIPPADAALGKLAPTAPGGADSATAPEANDPYSHLPNSVRRLFELERLRSEKEKASNPPAAPPAANAEMPRYGTGATDPLGTQRPAIQPLAIPQTTVEELLKHALTLPSGTAVAGQGVTLLDVLGKVTDRPKRLQIAHAYWQLTKLLGEYRFCLDESQQLQSIGLGSVDANLLDSAQRAADREVAAMELAVLNAQYDLADIAGLDLSGQLPLPTDPPHIATYNTFFERIFAESTPPGQTRLLHRTLPLQHQVIGVRAEAVHAAEQAFQEVAESYRAAQADAGDLFASLHEITVQQRAWMTAVARYNHSIADYALTVAGPETAGRQLVEILIRLSQADPQTGSGNSDDFSGPKPGPARQASGESLPPDRDETAKPGEPTLAPPRDPSAVASDSQGFPPVPMDRDPAVEPAAAEAPVLAGDGPAADPAVEAAAAEGPVLLEIEPAPDSTVSGAVPEMPATDPASIGAADDLRPSAGSEAMAARQSSSEASVADQDQKVASPAPLPVAEEIAEGGNTVSPDVAPSEDAAGTGVSPAPTRSRELVVKTRPMVAVEESDSPSGVQTVFRQPGSVSSAALARRYGDLAGLPTGVLAKRVAVDLHGSQKAAGVDGEGIDLAACLDGVPSAERHSVIEAYWEASHCLAEYEVYRRHVDMLDRLVESVTLGAAGTGDAMARLRASQLEAKADLLDSQSALLAAEYELTKRCGRSLAGTWLVPKTLPHAGDYRLNLESQPSQIVESWSLKRLATFIPTLNRSLKDRAAAVVAADSRRAEIVYAYQNRTLGFDSVLSAVDEQTRECLEFLNVLAAYNQSIADYVAAVVPEAIPQEQLVATLVVR